MIRFLAGFWIGALIGAIAVMLTTPQSGNDLQENIRARVDEVLAEGRKAAEWRRSELEARLADLRAGL